MLICFHPVEGISKKDCRENEKLMEIFGAQPTEGETTYQVSNHINDVKIGG